MLAFLLSIIIIILPQATFQSNNTKLNIQNIKKND